MSQKKKGPAKKNHNSGWLMAWVNERIKTGAQKADDQTRPDQIRQRDQTGEPQTTTTTTSQ